VYSRKIRTTHQPYEFAVVILNIYIIQVFHIHDEDRVGELASEKFKITILNDL
jgi:hypothetical protein